MSVARKLALVPPPPESSKTYFDDETEDSATRLAEWAKPSAKKKSKARTICDSRWKPLLSEARTMMLAGDWSEAYPRHFAALYAILHEKVYGIPATDLTPSNRLKAAGAAMHLLAQLGNDKNEMAVFVRWVWLREQSREKWRRENNRPGGRVSWTQQFSGSYLADYRVELLRKR